MKLSDSDCDSFQNACANPFYLYRNTNVLETFTCSIPKFKHILSALDFDKTNDDNIEFGSFNEGMHDDDDNDDYNNINANNVNASESFNEETNDDSMNAFDEFGDESIFDDIESRGFYV